MARVARSGADKLLAPVIGLVGLLGATMVSAQDLSAVIATKVAGRMEVAGPVTLASGTLSGATGMVTEGHYHLFTASSTATIVAGESYFCNNVMGNEDPMLEVGDPEMLDGYMLAVTPTISIAGSRTSS